MYPAPRAKNFAFRGGHTTPIHQNGPLLFRVGVAAPSPLGGLGGLGGSFCADVQTLTRRRRPPSPSVVQFPDPSPGPLGRPFGLAALNQAGEQGAEAGGQLGAQLGEGAPVHPVRLAPGPW